MMDILLQNGDHARDSRGVPVSVEGVEELIQRMLIRLSVKKGSFAPDESLGSELYRLRSISADLDRLALGYIQEALAPMTGVAVREVNCTQVDDESLAVAITVAAGGGQYKLEVQVT